LGWADFRVTKYEEIEKWWEIVCCAYFMVSLQSGVLNFQAESMKKENEKNGFLMHKWWDEKKGWKNILNNLRLIIQPKVCYSLLMPWLLVFSIPHLHQGFSKLINLMNGFQGFVPE